MVKNLFLVIALLFALRLPLAGQITTIQGSDAISASRTVINSNFSYLNTQVGLKLTDPFTTRGDIITRGTSAAQRLALGSTGYCLKSDGTDAVWNLCLTFVNDTNVTASLSAGTATLGWTGQLAVARGGSGAATLTGILKGNGTSAFSAAIASDVVGLFTGTPSGAKFLRDDGTLANPTSVPGGSNGDVQCNSTGTFGACTTTGSGSVVRATSPTFVTPVLGAATATSVNGLTITSSTGTFTVTNAKTLAVTNTLTFSGTDGTVFTFPGATDTVVTLTASQTLTNKTLTTPTIGSFANATHGHTNAAGGGQLNITTASNATGTPGSTTFLRGDNTWSTPSGGLVLVETQTASTSASLNFTSCITSTYDEYFIEIVNLIPATNAVGLIMRMSTDGGSSYDSGTNYSTSAYRFINSGAGAGGGTGQTSISLDGGNGTDFLSNTSTWGAIGGYKLFSPSSTALYKRVIGTISYFNSASALEGATVVGAYLSTTAVNAFQLLTTSGNITSGIVRCYGVVK
jgi:hypothetical protein